MSDKKIEPFAVYPSDQRAAAETTTGGWVRGVYQYAMEYTAAARSLRGVAFLMGGGLGVLCFLDFSVGCSLTFLVASCLRMHLGGFF